MHDIKDRCVNNPTEETLDIKSLLILKNNDLQITSYTKPYEISPFTK
jgi:hypothetical protein